MMNSLRSLVRNFVADQFPGFFHRLRVSRDQAYALAPLKDTPYGFRFSGPKDMMDGCFEPVETGIIRGYVKSSDLFVNVGANVGYYCCHSLALGTQTIAFEPSVNNFNCLLRNVEANHWVTTFEAFRLALSDSPGIIKLFGSGTGASVVPGWAASDSRLSELAPANTLDNVLSTRLEGKRCFVLMDVEGAELSVLKGAQKILSSTPSPTWMVEISIFEHLPKGVSINPNLLETFELFWSSGYCAYTADDNRTLVTRELIGEILKSGESQFGTHNFLFVQNA